MFLVSCSELNHFNYFTFYSLTYQYLLSALCQKGDITGAANILQVMNEKNIKMNIDMYNDLILGNITSG